MDPHEVETTAKRKLCRSGFSELKHIECRYEPSGRTLTLRGRVSFFYSTQTAQEILRDHENVHRIIKLIEVGGKPA